jgi:hypothetical protein
MSKKNLHSLSRVLAGLICVVGLSLAPGCSGKKCCSQDGQCSKKMTKCCSKDGKCCKTAEKPCAKKSCAKKSCAKGCTKKCCKNA